MPGTVQAANYDTGGQGVAYNVTAANGTANSYRSDGVDLEATADTQDTTPAGGAYDMGWTDAGAVVQVHRPGSHRRDLHGQLPGGLAVRGHRRAAHRQLRRHQPDRRGRRSEHRRLPDLDHGHRQRHPAGRRADADRRPGRRRLEPPLLGLHPGSGGGRRAGGGGTGPTEYCGTQDLALDQPTTASSTQDATAYPASDATDGDPGTRWSSASSDPQWLEVDLGSQQQICSVGILWEAAYASAFQIQVSNDNATWTTVYSTTTGTGGSETFTVSATDRYIRVYATARGHPVRRLDLRVRRLRPDHHRPGHRRQRQRRQRGLPVGQLHRAGRAAGPAGAQHHGPVGRGHAALR